MAENLESVEKYKKVLKNITLFTTQKDNHC